MRLSEAQRTVIRYVGEDLVRVLGRERAAAATVEIFTTLPDPYGAADVVRAARRLTPDVVMPQVGNLELAIKADYAAKVLSR